MKTNKKDNKGFSLVELIIVIAIMAVLIGVLAPAYLRYVEKSRKSADIQAIDEVLSAMEVLAIDPEMDFVEGTVMKVLLKNNAKTNATSFACNNIAVRDELQAIIGEYQLRSQDWKKIIIQGTVSDGKVVFTYSSDAPDGKSLKDCAPDMNITEDPNLTFQ